MIDPVLKCSEYLHVCADHKVNAERCNRLIVNKLFCGELTPSELQPDRKAPKKGCLICEKLLSLWSCPNLVKRI